MQIFIRICLLFTALSLFGLGGYLSYAQLAKEAGITYLAGILILVFAFLSQFKKFKGLGFEGELWEHKMEEAETLIARLRNLAAVLAEPTILLAARAGRYDTAFSLKERQDLVDRIRTILAENGIDESRIAAAVSDHRRYIFIDLADPIRRIAEYLSGVALKTVNEEAESRKMEFLTPVGEKPKSSPFEGRRQTVLRAKEALVMAAAKEPHETLAERLTEMLQNFPEAPADDRAAALDQARDAIEDIRYYATRDQLRRPEVAVG